MFILLKMNIFKLSFSNKKKKIKKTFDRNSKVIIQTQRLYHKLCPLNDEPFSHSLMQPNIHSRP